jgi:hypothetical protein
VKLYGAVLACLAPDADMWAALPVCGACAGPGVNLQVLLRPVAEAFARGRLTGKRYGRAGGEGRAP